MKRYAGCHPSPKQGTPGEDGVENEAKRKRGGLVSNQ